jgi:hypothetical protein
MTRSIPYWTTSVFCSTVTNLVLIYESVTSSASVVHWLTLHSWTFNSTTELNSELSYEWTNDSRIESSIVESYITTDGPSASLSWNKAPIWDLWPDFYYCQTVAGLLIWGALSDARTGLSFIITAGPRQLSHSRVRVPWDSRQYFSVSEIRYFPFRRLLRLAGLRWKYSTPPL